MVRLVLSVLVSSFLLLNYVRAHPIDEWGHPALYSQKQSWINDRATPGDYRLSGDIVPINYNIWLYSGLHLGQSAFTGRTQIHIRAENNVDEIVMHASQMKFADLEIKDLATDEIMYMRIKSTNSTTEFVTFASLHTTGLNLVAGKEYLLTINYEGTLRRDNSGFYLSSYQNEQGENVYMATTQFQATDARHAFPCFDEPGYKATFDIAIRHGSNYGALSNMPMDRRQESSSTESTTYFKTTPIMSTYLVAFIVSDFVNSEKSQFGINHRTFSRPGSIAEQQYGLQTSLRALNYLERTLDVPYGLPKVDSVAIPDFGAGAMENWGLVTYREEYLLFDHTKSTVNTQLNIPIMIAHEFTHQWFGDLVTPKWWEHLWLNEGFASLYEYLTVDEIYREYDVMQNFIVSHMQRALQSDAVKNPRPMTAYVEDPASISGLFDYVSYAKSACVLRMFQHVLGDNIFREGLTTYLLANSFGNTEPDMLFTHWENAAKDLVLPGLEAQSMRRFFESWTLQGGYPVLTVTRNYDSGTFEIHQQIFDNTNEPTHTVAFVVPFNYIYGNNPSFRSTRPDGFMLNAALVTVANDKPHGKDDWLLLNKQQTSYYRVNYDEDNWELLRQQLYANHKVIHPANRAALIDDSMKLALADRLPLQIALSLIGYIRNEEDYAPWAAANNVFSSMQTYFIGDNQYDLYQYYIGKLVEPYYKKIGIVEKEDDTMHEKLTRNIAINWACRANVGGCLDETNKRLHDVMERKIEIEPSLKVAIFCNGLINGGQDEFEYVFRKILNSTDQAERRQIMPTLGCSRNETLLYHFAMTSTAYSSEINYRAQERTNVLPAIIDKNEVGLRVAIEFLKDDHRSYFQLGSAGFMDSNPLLAVMSSIASRIYKKELFDEFSELVNEVRQGPVGSSSQLESMLTRAETNLKWVDKNRENYIKWLNSYKNSASSSMASCITLVITVAVSIRAYF